MKTLILTLILLLIAVPLMAASTTISWTPPTQNCDTSPVSVAGYYVKWGGVSGGPHPNEVFVNDPLATSYSVDVGSVSDTTLYFSTVTINTYGNRSDGPGSCAIAPEVAVYFPLITPNHPSNLTGVVD